MAALLLKSWSHEVFLEAHRCDNKPISSLSPITIDDLNEKRLKIAITSNRKGTISCDLGDTSAQVLIIINYMVLVTSHNEPSKYKTIAIPSMFSRQLHTILAKRIQKYFISLIGVPTTTCSYSKINTKSA